MSLSNNQKKFGRVAYDDVPDILQTDTTQIQSRKKCLVIKGTSPTLSTSAGDRKVAYNHKTISGEQLIKNGGTGTRILMGSSQHNFQVNPLALHGQFSSGDIPNCEIEVAVFCTGFMDDVTIFENIMNRGTNDNFAKMFQIAFDNVKNDAAYQNGLEDLINRGVRGYIRYNAVVRQLWHDPSPGSPADGNNFIIDGSFAENDPNSGVDDDIVGVSIGESKTGGIQPLNRSGYIWRPLDFMSLYALHHRMGLHAWTMQHKINIDCDVDREGYCLKEGYMGIDANPRTATVDLQIQQKQQNIHTIPIKLNPDRFDPSKPFVIEVKGFIYIPDNDDITPSSGKTLLANTNYPLALIPGSERYSEGNELELGYSEEMGVKYDGSIPNPGEDGDWYMRLSDIIYNVCGVTVWANT